MHLTVTWSLYLSIEVAERFLLCGFSTTLRWVPAYKFEGNGMAGKRRSELAACTPDIAPPPYESGNRGQDPEHEGLDRMPRQSQPTIPTT